MLTVMSAPAQSQANQPAASPAPLTPLQSVCNWTCGRSWTVTLGSAKGAKTRVTYVYIPDKTGFVLEGRGYFEPDNGQAWIDRHFFMADKDTGRVRYMGVSPKAGMTTGTVSIQPDGYTIIINPLNQPQQFGRIVNQFPNPQTLVITAYQSEDGFTKPSAVITLTKAN